MVFSKTPAIVFAGPHADRRGFVHDDDSLPVAKLIHFLCIGIMAGPEAVRVQPVIQVKIRHIHAGIASPSAEPERFPVNQEPGSIHPDFTDSEGLFIQVLPKPDSRCIQVRRSRPRFP